MATNYAFFNSEFPSQVLQVPRLLLLLLFACSFVLWHLNIVTHETRKKIAICMYSFDQLINVSVYELEVTHWEFRRQE